MARQDIAMNAALGELETTDNLGGRTFCDFTFLPRQDGEDNDRLLFAEILLSPTLAVRCDEGSELHVRIPYVADDRGLKARLRTDRGNVAMPEYRLNPETNRPWYDLVWENDSGTQQKLNASEMWGCNDKGVFILVLRKSSLAVFSGYETDMMVRPALKQNEAFLLKAFVGSLYQFPTTGVELINYLHANLENSGLAAKLQQEFTDDKMIIHNAYMDSATGELLLEVTEKDG